MNAMTENVSNTIQSAHTENTNVAQTAASTAAAVIPTELETSIVSASSITTAASEYNSTQKEVTITPDI